MARFALIFLLAACATEYSRKRTAGDDPSDPAAPASAPHDATLYQTPAAGASKGAWVCPMHSDVQAAAAGTCSKCGMSLVKR